MEARLSSILYTTYKSVEKAESVSIFLAMEIGIVTKKKEEKYTYSSTSIYRKIGLFRKTAIWTYKQAIFE